MMSSVLPGGGLELLCQSVKINHVDVDVKDGEKKLPMRDLLTWVRTNLITERPEMFMKGDTVRPGIRVLINESDWELEGQLDATVVAKMS
ncbi:ubiquitin-related modifier 1 homolog 2-like isoform X1 [Tasmannia lanceolata]|uniref:ubiquitin-related modifier 1 homolog 2-like isoform X1 n=1 Tax=Tasmannia lanceolata TaxID=3420 RepID=UPI00406366B6